LKGFWCGVILVREIRCGKFLVREKCGRADNMPLHIIRRAKLLDRFWNGEPIADRLPVMCGTFLMHGRALFAADRRGATGPERYFVAVCSADR